MLSIGKLDPAPDQELTLVRQMLSLAREMTDQLTPIRPACRRVRQSR
jgi:hypothetical protein